MIANCTCEHKDQDEMYGRGRRLMNARAVGDKQKGGLRRYRCTVCGKEHQLSE